MRLSSNFQRSFVFHTLCNQISGSRKPHLWCLDIPSDVFMACQNILRVFFPSKVGKKRFPRNRNLSPSVKGPTHRQNRDVFTGSYFWLWQRAKPSKTNQVLWNGAPFILRLWTEMSMVCDPRKRKYNVCVFLVGFWRWSCHVPRFLPIATWSMGKWLNREVSRQWRELEGSSGALRPPSTERLFWKSCIFVCQTKSTWTWLQGWGFDFRSLATVSGAWANWPQSCMGLRLPQEAKRPHHSLALEKPNAGHELMNTEPKQKPNKWRKQCNDSRQQHSLNPDKIIYHCKSVRKKQKSTSHQKSSSKAIRISPDKSPFMKLILKYCGNQL